MIPAQVIVATDEAPLTWKEICARYPDEWVVVVDIERVDHDFELRAARVVAHGASRATALTAARAVIAVRPSGSFFTGRKRGPVSGSGWL